MSALANLTTYIGAENKSLLSTIESSRGALKSLLSQIDPVATATERYNKKVDLLDKALANGRISQDVYAKGLSFLKTRLDDASGSLERHGSSLGNARMAQMELTHVIRASSDAYAAGASPLQIFSVEIGRVAEAASFAGGSLGKFGALMAGPWGMAITAGAVVLLPLIANLFKTNDAVGELVKKLKEDAQASIDAAIAKERFGRTLEGVDAAIRDHTAALKQQLTVDRDVADQANRQAQADLQTTLNIRNKTAATLAYVRAQMAADEADTKSPDMNRQFRLQQARAALPKLEADQAAADAAVQKADQELQLSRIALAEAEAKRMVDPLARIKKLYDDQRDAAVKAAEAQAKSGHIVLNVLTQQLAAIERNRDAAMKAAQAERSGANHETGRQITAAQGADIVRGIGGTVTSQGRTHEKQAELYAKYLAGTGSLAAKPGTSMHEWDQAVDIAKTVGISLAKIRKAFEDKGVHLTELLDEGDHFHAGWGKKGKSGEQLAREAETKRQQQIARAEAYSQEEAAAQRRLVDAQKKTADTAEERYQLAVQAINADAAARSTQIDNELAAKKITPAQKAHLDSLNEATRLQLLANAVETKNLADLEERVRLERLDLDNANALLRGGLDAARTQEERRQLQLQMLDNEKAEALAALELRRVKEKMTDAEYERLKTSIDIGDKNARASVTRDTMGPWDRWLNDAPKTAAEVKETLESIQVRAIDDLNRGLADATTNALHLHGVLGQVVSDLIEMVLKMGEAGGANGGGIGGFLSGLGKGLGAIFGGGGGGGGGFTPSGVSASMNTLLDSIGHSYPGFASGGSFDVGGRGGIDRNILSINGVPRVRVSATERVTVTPANQLGGEPTIVQLVVGPGQIFEPAVTAISGNVAVQTVRQAGIGAGRAQRQSL